MPVGPDTRTPDQWWDDYRLPADDLAAFVREVDRERSLAIVEDPRHPDKDAEIRRWRARIGHNTDLCNVMRAVVDRWADGSRTGSLNGTLAAVRLDERGHRGLGAAVDELWSVRPESGRERDIRRATEWARSMVTARPTPADLKGCLCDLGDDEAELMGVSRKRVADRLPAEREAISSEAVASEDEPRETAEEMRARIFEHQVGEEVKRLEVREEAQRRIRAKRRATRTPIAAGIIDDLDAIEPPAMLLDGLIPDAAVGFLAGRSGAYKSFLAVAWAFAIATGGEWGEHKARRTLKTLYVAAEGSAGAAARMKAWEARSGVSRAGKLLLYPKPIHLNDQDQAEELGEALAAGGYEYLVVDTYHRSAPGTEENDATAFGLVFDAVARFRDELGVGVLFVDHTGHNGDGRPRGSSAKGDDADFVLTATYDGPTRGPEVPRELRVTKLKDEESSGRWPIGLAEVLDGDGRPRGGFPVAVTREEDPGQLLTPDRPGWRLVAPDVPDGVVEKLKGASVQGRGVRLAISMWRLLAHVDPNAVGLTLPAIRRMVNDGDDPAPTNTGEWGEESVRKAASLLVSAELAGRKGDRLWIE